MSPSHRPTRTRACASGLALVASLILAACGSTTSSTGSAPSGQQSSQSSAQSVPAPTGTGTATSSTLPGTGKPTVTLGSKNYTEEFVLGDLYREALEAQGYSVELNQNIGPTSVTLHAMASGSLDMYPEYLNTFNAAVAGYKRAFPTKGAAYAAAQRYALAHHLELLAATPFSDTDALGVTVGYAQANRLRSLRDLSRVQSTLTVGGPPQFAQSHPGLRDLERTYGFSPTGYKDVGVGDQYADLNAGTLQAAFVNTTDGQLASGNYHLLGDPANVMGWGNVVPVVTLKAIATEGPAFASTINRISALLTIPVMRDLNWAVDVAGEDPATVAKQFLETHDMIPPSS